MLFEKCFVGKVRFRSSVEFFFGFQGESCDIGCLTWLLFLWVSRWQVVFLEKVLLRLMKSVCLFCEGKLGNTWSIFGSLWARITRYKLDLTFASSYDEPRLRDRIRISPNFKKKPRFIYLILDSIRLSWNYVLVCQHLLRFHFWLQRIQPVDYRTVPFPCP